MSLDWWADNDPDEARKRALVILGQPDNEPMRVKAVQVLGRVKDLPSQSRVFKALTQISHESEGSARDAARDALAKLNKG